MYSIKTSKTIDDRPCAEKAKSFNAINLTLLCTFADLVSKKDNCKRLQTAMGNLSETQRRRLYLHYSKNLTLRQIAEMEGVHLSAVGQSVRSAIKKLRKHLAD